MRNIMQEITEKLHQKMIDNFFPIAEDLAKRGHNKDEIVSIFIKQLNLKVQQYYDKINKSPKPIHEVLSNVLLKLKNQGADSKAEVIFYQMLIENGLRFQFQYSIGPYRVDFLFSGFLVVELDGPKHEKNHDDQRDKYMRKMGYKIIRVPIWILVSCPEAVIEEIKEAIARAK